jgi:hypothetical protein
METHSENALAATAVIGAKGPPRTKTGMVSLPNRLVRQATTAYLS